MEISNGFNTFLSQVGTKLAEKIPTTNIWFERFLSDRNESDFRFSKISEINILKIYKALKLKSNAGADFISTKFVKQIALMIITPLHHLNLSLETGFVPKKLKIVKVVHHYP